MAHLLIVGYGAGPPGHLLVGRQYPLELSLDSRSQPSRSQRRRAMEGSFTVHPSFGEGEHVCRAD
jgi:hypothetical protein